MTDEQKGFGLHHVGTEGAPDDRYDGAFLSKKAGRMEDRLEITPAMVEAGIKALKECESPYQDDLVKDVFTAMEAARRKQLALEHYFTDADAATLENFGPADGETE